jgi:hypothetical protein
MFLHKVLRVFLQSFLLFAADGAGEQIATVNHFNFGEIFGFLPFGNFVLLGCLLFLLGYGDSVGMLRFDVLPMFLQTVGPPGAEYALDVDEAVYFLDFGVVEEVEVVLEF